MPLAVRISAFTILQGLGQYLPLLVEVCHQLLLGVRNGSDFGAHSLLDLNAFPRTKQIHARRPVFVVLWLLAHCGRMRGFGVLPLLLAILASLSCSIGVDLLRAPCPSPSSTGIW